MHAPANLCVSVCIAIHFLIGSSANANMPWIEVSKGGDSFVFQGAEKQFSPWGFNYDHDADGRLLEDYWIDDWNKVEQAFSDIKKLGANVVRIHLQFGQFMDQHGVANETNLSQLEKLIELAERTELYLNITGLGCYHKQDVPVWYDDLNTAQRWSAQADFWEAIAGVCANSPAIFCYDLMNEPVVPGGNKRQENWLGPGFGGKHFVQFICRDRAGEDREKLASRWTKTLVSAIRKHDTRHLITIGLVPWSLDRPGLTSGFNPHAISDQLDFISVHLYPETGKLEEATETLQGFKISGKPLVVEETFPLKCNADELSSLIDSTHPLVSGWIGFFWGETQQTLASADTISAAITKAWLDLFQRKSKQMTGQGEKIVCEGDYSHHLQGVCIAPSGDIFWSFTTKLVHTDSSGKVLQKVSASNHHGDLCFDGDKIYVAVNLGEFNKPAGQADSWVYVYEASNLQLKAKHPVPQVVHGAGGIGVRGDRFYVVGGLPDGIQENYVYEYDADFNFFKKYTIPSGHTHLGIQTATFAQGHWWFGCYGDPKILLVTDGDFRLLGRYEFDCSFGIEAAGGGHLWAASGACHAETGCHGTLRLATPDDQTGLKILPSRESQ